ncbi:Aminoglycoside phosphotransferase, partial [Metarhizium majus ARSEF 297]
MALPDEYTVDDEISAFFKKTTTSRTECDAQARRLVGSQRVVAIAIQGACSYSVYAGGNLEYVVQCRLRSLALNTEIHELATEIYGSLVPTISFEGILGDTSEGIEAGDREPLYIYLMSRMPGITQLDFILSQDSPQDSPKYFPLRQNFISDVAHFFARSWLAPQKVSREYRHSLKASYIRDLELLRESLPNRFHSVLQACLGFIDDIMTLPVVLLHKDFGACNLLVDEASCRLKGVIDWAEAVVCPFGLNLHSLQAFTGTMHLRNGWSPFPDYYSLEKTFWRVFSASIGGLSDDKIRTAKRARALGLLLSHGFTSRLANEADPVPLKDDEHGRYNLMYLDAFLIHEETKLDGVE